MMRDLRMEWRRRGVMGSDFLGFMLTIFIIYFFVVDISGILLGDRREIVMRGEER